LSTGDGSQWTIPTVSWCPPVHRGQFLMDNFKCPPVTVLNGQILQYHRVCKVPREYRPLRVPCYVSLLRMKGTVPKTLKLEI